eukprot:TRINITY_DN13011_c0_g1_i1.p2 TRINITY_DN13011_c0_g1~~TRINITY_DN13011_c0_g1_i1.p2  ORF type:complete len:184 (+),score=64.49 TRINITY_DN13011_c0_g1_i1:120-671(+)
MAKRVGEQTFQKLDKINSELFTLTYGSIVNQLIADHDDVAEVNERLEKMGYNIGLRLIEEFLSKSGLGRCNGLKETAEVIAKVGFKMFLGITATVTNWSADEKEFSLLLPDDNPLTEFVELPDQYDELVYASLLLGVIRGALEMVQMKVSCRIARDGLKGDDVTEIRVLFLEYLQDEVPVGEE